MRVFDQTSATLHEEIQFYCMSLSQTEEGSWVGQGCFEMQKSILVLWMWTHFWHALTVVCGAVHYRHRDWIQSCGCTSSYFSDMNSISKAFFPMKATNTYESLKIAIFEIRIEFTDRVLGECYFRAVTEFGNQSLKTSNFQAKWGWLVIAFRGCVRFNFSFKG